MKSIIYVLVAKNFFEHENNEYATAVDSKNISLWCSFGEAAKALNQAKSQLIEEGYYILNCRAEDSDYGRQYWIRLENGKGRAVVLEILRKSVSGDLVIIGQD